MGHNGGLSPRLMTTKLLGADTYAYAAAGIALPRTARQQFDAVPLCGSLPAHRRHTGARVTGEKVRTCDHASRVIIRHAPRTVQPTSQATMTHTATVVDSGSSAGDPWPPAGPPPPPPSTGSRPGARWAMARPTTARCKLAIWGMRARERIGVSTISSTIIRITGTVR